MHISCGCSTFGSGSRKWQGIRRSLLQLPSGDNLGKGILIRARPNLRGQIHNIADGVGPSVTSHRTIAFLDPPSDESLACIVGPVQIVPMLIACQLSPTPPTGGSPPCAYDTRPNGAHQSWVGVSLCSDHTSWLIVLRRRAGFPELSAASTPDPPKGQIDRSPIPTKIYHEIFCLVPASTRPPTILPLVLLFLTQLLKWPQSGKLEV